MRVEDGYLTTEQPKRSSLLEAVLSPANLNRAYLQVKRNGGAAGLTAWTATDCSATYWSTRKN